VIVTLVPGMRLGGRALLSHRGRFRFRCASSRNRWRARRLAAWRLVIGEHPTGLPGNSLPARLANFLTGIPLMELRARKEKNHSATRAYQARSYRLLTPMSMNPIGCGRASAGSVSGAKAVGAADLPAIIR